MKEQTKTITITLNEAKAIIQCWIDGDPEPDEEYYKGLLNERKECLNILNQIEQVNEEERAVIWLMKNQGWNIYWSNNRDGWVRSGFSPIAPIKEANKLGWGLPDPQDLVEWSDVKINKTYWVIPNMLEGGHPIEVKAVDTWASIGFRDVTDQRRDYFRADLCKTSLGKPAIFKTMSSAVHYMIQQLKCWEEEQNNNE